MKLIHLSDLHLGKRVNETSMLEDQKYILDRILDAIDSEAPDAVLIAGDVYDRSVPAAEAMELLDSFLCRLARRKLPVFLISGNHDSPERLAFGGTLMRASGVHISPVYDGTVTPIRLADARGPVDFWLLPFLKPAQVRRFYPEETVETYTDACRVAIEHMDRDPNARHILLAHQFVTGAATCDSEEISVGGSDNVDASVFDGFAYVALGHIHGPQNIVENRIRYCGTPLKYSFSECRHHKSITVVELEEGAAVRTLPLVPLRDMRELRGSYSALTDPENYRGTPTGDYLHIILTDEEDVPEAAGRLRAVYPNLLKLSYDNARTRSSSAPEAAGDIGRKSPLDLFSVLYESQNNQPMSDVQTAFVRELIESVWEERL